jgi:hypothetical protein
MLSSVADRRRIERFLIKNGFCPEMVEGGMKAAVKNIGRAIARLGGRGSPARKDSTVVAYWLDRFIFDQMVATRFNPEYYRRWLKK